MDQFIIAGERSSQPSLLQKSDDGCHFELIWYAAAACAVGHEYGDNCQVYYPAMGNKFISAVLIDHIVFYVSSCGADGLLYFEYL